MELFGFSAAKIITILIIAVVIFGPAQVAEMVKTVGRTIRDVRRYLNDMTKEFNDATGGLREEFAGIAQDVRGELAATQADLRSQLDLTGIFAEAAATTTESKRPSVLASATGPESIAGALPPPARESRPASVPTPIGNGPTAIGGVPVAATPTREAGDRAVQRATKADPLADLPMLTSSRPDSDAVLTTIAGPPRSGGSPRAPRRTIGRSGAGTAYLRRKDSASASCRGLCRSACVHHAPDINGLTVLRATASDRVAAP